MILCLSEYLVTFLLLLHDLHQYFRLNYVSIHIFIGFFYVQILIMCCDLSLKENSYQLKFAEFLLKFANYYHLLLSTEMFCWKSVKQFFHTFIKRPHT